MIYLRWIGILLIKLLAWPYSLIVWPIVFPLRNQIRKSYYSGSSFEKAGVFILWITLNDENELICLKPKKKIVKE
jgi:hypothetical protein